MDNSSIKKELRKKYLDHRCSLDPDFRKAADQAICDNLTRSPEVAAAKAVGAFITDGAEPDLSAFIERAMQSGKRIYLPRFKHNAGDGYEMVEIKDLKNDLVPGKYGIMEPAQSLEAASEETLNSLLWLVPGVVFDMTGSRLGRGKGVYDRLLNKRSGIRIGIFYQCQENTVVPVEAHDCPLDMIVTENGMSKFK
ncbi:MAG: 5-formyltetrahydrofolate cyclo-ligase [Victivallaceae bacterium]